MKNADKIAFERLISAEPVLVGCRKMGDVFPDFPKNRILHSGPDLAWEDMKGPHRKGITGAALFEGLAENEADAENKIRSGEIEVKAANDCNSGAPGAGITSYSMAVLEVREANSGIIAVAPPIEGEQGGGLGGWGVYNDVIAENLRLIRDVYAPVFTRALETVGGINVAELFGMGLSLGDEEHTRQFATDKVFFSKLTAAVLDSDCSAEEKLAFLRWANANSEKRFVHHIGCASAVASLKSAANIPGSTLVTAMCGNGHEFGIKLSGTGETWYTAPAPTFHGKYWKPEYTDADSSPWLGDSSNVEAWGFGGMAAAASPVLLANRDETLWDGIAQCAEMAMIAAGVNPRNIIPQLPSKSAPAGILAEKAVEKGITPKLHGGILSRVSGGQIGVGYARVPLECFEKAMGK